MVCSKDKVILLRLDVCFESRQVQRRRHHKISEVSPRRDGLFVKPYLATLGERWKRAARWGPGARRKMRRSLSRHFGRGETPMHWFLVVGLCSGSSRDYACAM